MRDGSGKVKALTRCLTKASLLQLRYVRYLQVGSSKVLVTKRLLSPIYLPWPRRGLDSVESMPNGISRLPRKTLPGGHCIVARRAEPKAPYRVGGSIRKGRPFLMVGA